MTAIDTETLAEFAPLALGVALVLIATYNYLQGIYGGAIVAGVGAIVTFALTVLSSRQSRSETFKNT
ncbi:hypothetical protein ACFO5R_15365 [Halosolutus amylolyticus]|uniref:Uncharacterized protein n=1 Tax=Halosolutus amylolyticus TaxID=2932267 RepID=A0ABD5PS85_9EURY|nr:hypothetical protein [Halosolutus amylolyticus]